MANKVRKWVIRIDSKYFGCMNSSSRSFYMENNKLGWPIPNLKKLFSTAVAYKKKFKNGIISSWEDYNNNNNMSIYLFFIIDFYVYEFL